MIRVRINASGLSANAIEKKLLAYMNKIRLDTARIVTEEVRNSTPKDTHHATEQWILTTGAELSSRVAQAEATEKAWRALPKKARYAFVRNVAPELRSGRPTLKSTTASDRVILFNQASYITYLNRGSSQQAPKMFIEKAIAQGVAKAKAKHGAK